MSSLAVTQLNVHSVQSGIKYTCITNNRRKLKYTKTFRVSVS